MILFLWSGDEKRKMAADKIFLKIGRLAQEAGISHALIRAWEKRYVLWTPERGPGGQRLYGLEDQLLIRYLVAETRKGRRIGELAALGRKELLDQMKAENGSDSPQEPIEAMSPKISSLDEYIQPLVAGAEKVDLAQLHNGFNRALLELSSDQVVYSVIIPAMAEVGQLYLTGRISVAGEHLISSMGEHILRNCIDQAQQASPRQDINPILCACFPGEEHRLGLLAVNYGLTREGHNTVFLGAALPVEGLEQAIMQVNPVSIWLSVSSSRLFRKYRSEYASLVLRHSNRFVFGGRGVDLDDPLQHEENCIFWNNSLLNRSALQDFIRGRS